MAQITAREGSAVRKDKAPCAYVTAGNWPDVTLSPDAPAAAYYGREVAVRIRGAMRAQGLRPADVGRRSGLTHSTIGRVLDGTVYPDLATLARLEAALGVDLYPTGLYRLHQPPPA